MQKNDVFQWKMSYLAADIIVRHPTHDVHCVCTIVITACRNERMKKTHLLMREHFLQWRKNDLPALGAMN
jgi:hypothetical protein